MKRLSVVASLLATFALLATFLPAAQAQTPDYVLRASSQAVTLAIGGNPTVNSDAISLGLFSTTSVEGTSAPLARTTGVGSSLVAASQSLAEIAGASGAIRDPAVNRNCGTTELPDPIPTIIDTIAALACSDAAAGHEGGLATAIGNADVAALDVNGRALLDLLYSLLPLDETGIDVVPNEVADLARQPLLDICAQVPLDQVLEPLFGGLNEALDGIASNGGGALVEAVTDNADVPADCASAIEALVNLEISIAPANLLLAILGDALDFSLLQIAIGTSTAKIADLPAGGVETTTNVSGLEISSASMDDLLNTLADTLLEGLECLVFGPNDPDVDDLEECPDDPTGEASLFALIPGGENFAPVRDGITSNLDLGGIIDQILAALPDTGLTDPILTLDVGSANARATLLGNSTAVDFECSAPIIHLTVSRFITTVLREAGVPIDDIDITIEPGASVVPGSPPLPETETVIAEGTPLETRIAIGATSEIDGTATAPAVDLKGCKAEGVTVELLRGLDFGTPLDGGFYIAASTAEATAGDLASVETLQAPPATPTELPRTGPLGMGSDDLALLLMGGVGALAIFRRRLLGVEG